LADLGAFLDQAARTPFAWGKRDCCLWLADWLIELGHPDTAAHLRGRYATAYGCARLVKRGGGLVAVVEDCVSRAGLPRTTAPKAGDIGVVTAETERGRQMVGAICTGPRWAILGSPGLICAPANPIAAWAV
jgi:hypothetical protein